MINKILIASDTCTFALSLSPPAFSTRKHYIHTLGRRALVLAELTNVSHLALPHLH